jgi:hypothetical protein
MAGGRPVIYTQKFRKELLKKFEIYIDTEEMPVIAEFAYKNKIPKTNLYDFKEFSTLLKICKDKKETYLETKGLKNEVNNTMAIFSLKQLGWSDKLDTKNTNVNINATQETLNKIYESISEV